MNTQSDVMRESSLDSRAIAPDTIPAAQRLYWSIRRELWESRSLYIAPLIVAALFLVGFLISTIHLPANTRAVSGLDPAHQRAAIATPYDMVAGLMMLTAMIVGAFYCLEALHSERRDRSILFWKSLPVSDLATVLSKAIIPIVGLPLFTFALTVATQLIMLLLSSAVLRANGLNATTLWAQLSFFQMSVGLLYHLVTIHALWHAPLYSWLLMVSAWARRMAILWATLPLIAIGFLEKIAFNTSHFGNLLQYRLTGGGMEAVTMPGTFPMDPMTHFTAGAFLSSPGLWGGLAFTAACLAIAVRLRRYRGPI
jgi:ABC-2 type transport system permease protein